MHALRRRSLVAGEALEDNLGEEQSSRRQPHTSDPPPRIHEGLEDANSAALAVAVRPEDQTRRGVGTRFEDDPIRGCPKARLGPEHLQVRSRQRGVLVRNEVTLQRVAFLDLVHEKGFDVRMRGWPRRHLRGQSPREQAVVTCGGVVADARALFAHVCYEALESTRLQRAQTVVALFEVRAERARGVGEHLVGHETQHVEVAQAALARAAAGSAFAPAARPIWLQVLEPRVHLIRAAVRGDRLQLHLQFPSEPEDDLSLS